MSSRPSRALLTVIMNVLIALAVADTLRLIVRFFGQLAEKGWGEALVAATNFITLPLGIEAVKTPYGGIFDVNAAVTVVALLLLEWVLSFARSDN